MRFLLGAYNFLTDSQYTPNANMESNSFWSGSGDQASVWYANSSYFTGSRSLYFNTTSAFSTSLKHLAGSSDTRWDSFQVRYVSGALGMTAADSAAPLGRSSILSAYRDLNFSFMFPSSMAATSIVKHAYISIKCSSGFNPLVFYPRISTMHHGTAYQIGTSYLLTGWYRNSATHQASFQRGNWYYGYGQPYQYDLASDLQQMISMMGGISPSNWINITFLGDSGPDGSATFYQDNETGPSSDSAVMDIELVDPLPAAPGSNFVLHPAPAPPLYPGSTYVLEGWSYLVSGAGQYVARVVSSVGSTIVSGNIYAQHGRWTKFSQIFSVAAISSGVNLRIDDNSGYASLVALDDVTIKDTKNLAEIGVIEIYPEWEMRRHYKKLTSLHRTKIGALFSYTWGNYERFEIPLRHVPAADAMIINSWWRSADMLMLKIESGGVWEVNSLACVNKTAPFTRMEKGYVDQMHGTIELETF